LPLTLLVQRQHVEVPKLGVVVRAHGDVVALQLQEVGGSLGKELADLIGGFHFGHDHHVINKSVFVGKSPLVIFSSVAQRSFLNYEL
jgi:hypothetical protein